MSRALKICIALIGAPLAWVVQMSSSEPLVSGACYPHRVPLEVPRWSGLSPLLMGISLACLVAGILSGIVAWRSWREGWPEPFKFLSLMGVISSFIFIVALLLTTSASLLVLPCRPWF